MASSDWQEIYRTYSAAELTAERARLVKIIEEREGISSQSFGAKSWQNDLPELRNKLHAVVRILNENQAPRAARTGIMDFSDIRIS